MNNIMSGFMEYLKRNSKGNYEKVYEIAAVELNNYLKKICTNDKGQIGGDLLLNYTSKFAGISCLMAALKDGSEFVSGNNDSISLAALNTDCGLFYMGESINKYVFYKDDSMYKRLLTGIGAEEKEYHIKIEEILSECTKNYGNQNYRLWNGQLNPYESRKQDAQIYGKTLMLLKDYGFNSEQMYELYGLLVEKTIKQVRNVFPKDIDPLLLSMGNIIFYSHMECRE